MPTYRIETSLGGRVAGIDEAGRGPLAGPVVAAAVVIDPKRLPRKLLRSIDDSKQMTREAREDVFERLMGFTSEGLWFGISEGPVEEIDRINILQSTFAAMCRAVTMAGETLGGLPDIAIIDGNRAPKQLPCRAHTVVGGDARCLSVAAASILAKVTRDRMMRILAREFPGYGWETNVGYGTPEHLDGLSRLGPTIHHRRSFAPVAQLSLALDITTVALSAADEERL